MIFKFSLQSGYCFCCVFPTEVFYGFFHIVLYFGMVEIMGKLCCPEDTLLVLFHK